MTFDMTLKDEKLSLGDILKGAVVIVPIIVSFVLMSAGISNLTEKVVDIRSTQMENTKKNDLRWELIEAKQNQLELSQRLLEQRMDAFDNRK